MHRVAICLIRDAQQVFDVEVRLHRRFTFADEIRFIRLEAMQREAIFLRKHGHGADAEFDRGALYANGDFAAIRNEDALYAPGLGHGSLADDDGRRES